MDTKLGFHLKAVRLTTQEAVDGWKKGSSFLCTAVHSLRSATDDREINCQVAQSHRDNEISAAQVMAEAKKHKLVAEVYINVKRKHQFPMLSYDPSADTWQWLCSGFSREAPLDAGPWQMSQFGQSCSIKENEMNTSQEYLPFEYLLVHRPIQNTLLVVDGDLLQTPTPGKDQMPKIIAGPTVVLAASQSKATCMANRVIPDGMDVNEVQVIVRPWEGTST